MFSGIVEAKAKVVDFKPRGNIFELTVYKPKEFDDLKIGDSIAVNGVCLTVERFDSHIIQFAVADETLKVTEWDTQLTSQNELNLERSLKFGDRIHGHVVQGHVDAMGEVLEFQKSNESAILQILLPKTLLPLVWKKGSLAINGVSLTINEVQQNRASFCLVPETLKRTNLSDLKPGQKITLEADTLARFYLRQRELNAE